MHIGIVTFHNAINYGAAIQCFALKKFIENSGHKVDVINFRCKSIEKAYPKTLHPMVKKKELILPVYWKKALIKCKECILTKNDWVERYNRFERFQDNFLNVYKTDCYKDQLKKCDIIVFGSDQIWNKGLTRGDASFYFGEVETIAKKISYAASCYYVDELEDEDISKILYNFAAISVRESSLARFIQRKCKNGEKIYWVMDPVFLLNENDYLSLIPNRIKKENYCFAYFVNENTEMMEYIDRLRGNGIEVVELHYFRNTAKRDDNKIYNLGPIEFLNYLFYSDIVITDSFHGTALSIIFKKNFWTFGNSMRIKDLLCDIGLEYRMINEKSNNLNNNPPIDYTDILSHLEDAIETSKKYLIDAIGE